MIAPHPMASAGQIGYYPPEEWEDSSPVAVSKLTDDQWDDVRRLDALGMPRTEIARQMQHRYGVQIGAAAIGRTLGPKDRGGPSEGSRNILIRLNDDELERLRAIADELGYTGYRGKTAGIGSMSELLRAIARGEVAVTRRANATTRY